MSIHAYIYPIYIAAVIVIAAVIIMNRWRNFAFEKHILSFEEIQTSINSLMAMHIEIYEKDVMQTKAIFTQGEFEIFYKDLVSNIVSSISPMFMKKASIYLTEEAVYQYIAKYVMDYLKLRLKEGLDNI